MVPLAEDAVDGTHGDLLLVLLPQEVLDVSLQKKVLDSILSYCQMKHPNECILILKGKSKQGQILIDGLVIPPFNYSGPTFAGFPHSFLPFDMSYVGMVHSHPSGSADPSVTDFYIEKNAIGIAAGDMDQFHADFVEEPPKNIKLIFCHFWRLSLRSGTL